MNELVDKTRSYLTRRKRDYLDVFTSEPGKKVLSDLAKFCRANETTFNPDPRVAAMLDGRREVFLRIQEHLNLSNDELYNLYRGIK